MRFNPKSENEIQSAGLIEEGIYNFQITLATDEVSSKGNEMIKLTIKIWDNNDCEKIIFDYLLEAMHYKLRHFAEVTGLIKKYESGELTASDCVGKSGKLNLVIQEGKPKPDGGFYPNKNSVKDYVKLEEKTSPIVSDHYSQKDKFDDVLPF